MKSVTSYFKISPAVIREDLRRFWVIPVFSFIFLFFSCVFYILMHLNELGKLPTEISDDNYGLCYFIDTLLNGYHPAVLVDIIGVSVLSVLLTFRYLHKNGSVLAVHSQPFTRATLMNSHALSAVIFTILPFLLITVILLLIARPCYFNEIHYNDLEEVENLFSRMRILRWLLKCVLSSLFIIAVSVLGGMLTGTVFHHAFAALGFNAVLPLCIGLWNLYFSTYLFGFTISDFTLSMLEHSHPLVLLFGIRPLTAGITVYFIMAILLLYALAMLLYSRRKLERTGDGVVFQGADILITMIFGFLGMTGAGMSFRYLFDENTAVTVVGYVVGAIAGMLVIRMIIHKSVRIFTKELAAVMGAYFVLAGCFLGGILLDVTNFETRVREDAACIDVSVSLLEESSGFESYGEPMEFQSETAKEAIRALHREIIAEKDTCREAAKADEDRNLYSDASVYEDFDDITFTYYSGTSKEDRKVIEKRVYSVPTYLLRQSRSLKNLLENDEWKELNLKKLNKYDDFSSVNICFYDWDTSSNWHTCSDSEILEILKEAIQQDIRERTAENILQNHDVRCGYGKSVANLEITYRPKTERQTSADGGKEAVMSATSAVIRDGDGIQTNEDFIYYIVSSGDTHTIAWLKEHQYWNVPDLQEVPYNYAAVYEIVQGDVSGDSMNYENNSEAAKLNKRRGIILNDRAVVKAYTEPEQIRSLYENCKSSSAFGLLHRLSSKKDNVYYVCFYQNDGDIGGSYEAFNAFIRGTDLP